jgi:hypothetical protein
VNLQVQLKPPILIAPRFLCELLQIGQVLWLIRIERPAIAHIPRSKPLTLLISPPQSILPEPFFRLLFVKAHFVPPLTKFNIAPCQTLCAE